MKFCFEFTIYNGDKIEATGNIGIFSTAPESAEKRAISFIKSMTPKGMKWSIRDTKCTYSSDVERIAKERENERM